MLMRDRLRTRGIYFLAAIAAGAALSNARAQGFECSKASTATEKLICGDPELSAADAALTKEFRAQLANVPHFKKQMLDRQRAWLRDRDESCKDKDCVASKYAARLQELSKTALCNKIADRYIPLAGAQLGVAPLQALASAEAPGFRLAPDLAHFDTPTKELAAWGAEQHPPISVSDAVRESLKVVEPWVATLNKAPGLNYYTVTSLQGTAHCAAEVTFSIKDSVAVPAPPRISDEESPCGDGLFFASVDNVPAFVIQNYGYGPEMTAEVDVSTWHQDRFERACAARMFYAPAFSSKTLNDWGESCNGAQCDELRKHSFDLVKAANNDASVLTHKAVAKLTATQLATWKKLADRQELQSDNEQWPLGTVQVAARVPVVLGDQVLLATVGEFTIGWREFADWGVSFWTFDGEALVTKARIAVGMSKGALETVDVMEAKPNSTED